MRLLLYRYIHSISVSRGGFLFLPLSSVLCCVRCAVCGVCISGRFGSAPSGNGNIKQLLVRAVDSRQSHVSRSFISCALVEGWCANKST